ncbi:MAG TPA: SPFH domain-containing protein [Thermoanaerobaculia bacterium]|nr:SPFH domain-containing protein [Thermoanaerobaculia bacterium]
MGFFDNLKNQIGSQFIEIIEWLDDSNDTLVYRFPVYNQEIKMGAQLIVRENQVALFINEGEVADLFKPGRYELSTQNLPVLTTLRGWKYGFQSPFKAEVYFFNTRLFTDLKWGTANPVMMRDAEFGMIRIRAFGTYALKIADPKEFFRTVVGTQGLTTTDDILGQLRSTIISHFSDMVAESKIAALDLASSYRELGQLAQKELGPSFTSFGLELARFVIDNVSLPEEVEAAIDQRTKLGVFGDRLHQYAQMQTAESIKVAAANPGGLAGAGVGIGAGMAMGQAMSGAFNAPPPPSGSAAPPPPPGASSANAPRWSLAIDGKTYGPYTDDALRGMVDSGQVTASTNAWRPGAASWAPLETYDELGLGASAPPPPPPPSPPPK